MKPIFVALLLMAAICFGQDIGDVTVSNSKLTVYDSQHRTLFTKILEKGDELAGFSAYLVVIKSPHNIVRVYDQRLTIISSKILENGDNIKNVVGQNIIVRSKDDRVTTYSKDFRVISTHHE